MSFYSAEHAMSYTEMALLRLSVMVGRRDEQLEKWCWRSEVGAATEAPEEGVALRRRRWSEREHRATQCPATWPFLDENAVVLSLDFESFMHLFFMLFYVDSRQFLASVHAFSCPATWCC